MKLKQMIFLCLMATVACGDDDDKQITYDQVERMGRPAINTVFSNVLIRTPMNTTKDSFNVAEPKDDVARYASTFTANLTALRSLYGGPTNDIPTFVGILLPDVLTMNLSRANGTSGYLGDLLTATGDGGRILSDDVIDASLSVVVFPGAPSAFTSDGVSNDNGAFLSTFPYLKNPN